MEINNGCPTCNDTNLGSAGCLVHESFPQEPLPCECKSGIRGKNCLDYHSKAQEPLPWEDAKNLLEFIVERCGKDYTREIERPEFNAMMESLWTRAKEILSRFPGGGNGS